MQTVIVTAVRNSNSPPEVGQDNVCQRSECSITPLPGEATTLLPAKRRRDQVRVHIFGHLLPFALRKAVDPTVGVVIRDPSFGGGVTAPLDHHGSPSAMKRSAVAVIGPSS